MKYIVVLRYKTENVKLLITIYAKEIFSFTLFDVKM